MIREFHAPEDTRQVMDLWLEGNKDAHSFIPEEYWRSHLEEVQEQILQAEVFVCDTGGKIQGFIGIVNGYIAGIFVDKNYRSRGIGKQLLDYAKGRHAAFTLSVYQKNTGAVAFYLREGFSVRSEAVDETTGEYEYTMFWKKKQTAIAPAFCSKKDLR